MRLAGIEPTTFTYVCILNCCSLRPTEFFQLACQVFTVYSKRQEMLLVRHRMSGPLDSPKNDKMNYNPSLDILKDHGVDILLFEVHLKEALV